MYAEHAENDPPFLIPTGPRFGGRKMNIPAHEIVVLISLTEARRLKLEPPRMHVVNRPGIGDAEEHNLGVILEDFPKEWGRLADLIEAGKIKLLNGPDVAYVTEFLRSRVEAPAALIEDRGEEARKARAGAKRAKRKAE